MIMNVNIYNLKLRFILVNVLQQQKLKGLDRDIIFEVKRQKALEKKLNCRCIRINANNDLDYELGNIHTFIYEFKNNKKLEIILE